MDSLWSQLPLFARYSLLCSAIDRVYWTIHLTLQDHFTHSDLNYWLWRWTKNLQSHTINTYAAVIVKVYTSIVNFMQELLSQTPTSKAQVDFANFRCKSQQTINLLATRHTSLLWPKAVAAIFSSKSTMPINSSTEHSTKKAWRPTKHNLQHLKQRDREARKTQLRCMQHCIQDGMETTVHQLPWQFSKLGAASMYSTTGISYMF